MIKSKKEWTVIYNAFIETDLDLFNFIQDYDKSKSFGEKLDLYANICFAYSSKLRFADEFKTIECCEIHLVYKK